VYFVADFLSSYKAAVSSKAEIIVFADVHLMADSTSIISLNKIIILSIPNLGCN
jgi:quinolinate synthase